jgi:GNAT superfamily N-acetyltransferase
MKPPTVVPLDLSDPLHAQAMLALLDEYAAGPTGRGYGLEPQARERLPAMLAARPHYWGCLAFVDGEPAGLANCFETVSTFLAMPLLNVHDIAVSPRFQRRGVGAALLAAVEAAARARLLQADAGGARGQPRCATPIRARGLCRLCARSADGAGGVHGEEAGLITAGLPCRMQ